MNPSKRKITVLKQIVKLIPRSLVPKLARKHGVDKQSRTFSPWSHVLSLLHAQLSHALSLNDVCDSLRNHSGALQDIRGATPPSRNGLSHANRERNAAMAEDLFWSVLCRLRKVAPRFGLGHGYSGIPHRFKRTINAVDSTTIKLFANCIHWAKHRRRKAAAKMHLRLDLQTFLPKYVLVKSANTHDSTEASEVCADLADGEVVVFDKAYAEFSHLSVLNRRGIFWVTRARDNLKYEVVGQHRYPCGKIIRDVRIRLTGIDTTRHYPETLRLVEAIVEVDGKEMKMTFIANNFEWASSSICDLYRSRWGIEVFFKEIKQTLQIADFLGYNENAVKWQIWTALLVYVLLRYVAHTRAWPFSFPRLFTALRGVLWHYFDMNSVLESCGTAGAPLKVFKFQ
jgi:Transposase DDE domain/Domain of unknown function (DUF4372)